MIFHSLIGFLVWGAATLLFRFYGQLFWYPDDIVTAIIFIIVAPVMWGFMVLYLGVLRVYPENRALAAIGFCLPGMILDAIVTANYGLVFPELDPSMDAKFGALMLWAYAFLLFGGYSSDRRVRRQLKLRLENVAAP